MWHTIELGEYQRMRDKVGLFQRVVVSGVNLETVQDEDIVTV